MIINLICDEDKACIECDVCTICEHEPDDNFNQEDREDYND